MTCIYIFIFFLSGLLSGKLLNLLADAATAEEGRWGGTVLSSGCKTKRTVVALLPLAGFFRNSTACSHCCKPIPLRVPLVELLTGVAFAFLFGMYGWSLELPVLIIFSSLFITLFITDIEHTLLPNVITYPGMGIAVLIALLITLLNIQPQWAYRFSENGFLSILNIYIVNAVAGGLCGFLFFLVVALIFRGGMGFGDVKLAALMGLAMGLPTLLVAVFLGIVGGGLVAAILLIAKLKKRKEAIPFGPFLCLASIVALMWGKAILAWYLNLA
jgi:leader peptidase (prepilin peptidase)/N-methyltransferase